MTPTAQKLIVAFALAIVPFVLNLAMPWDEWMQTLGTILGEAAYSTTLNNVLNGYTTPPTSVWHSTAFWWCWYVPLAVLGLYYLGVDRLRYATTSQWAFAWFVAALICAVIAFIVVGQERAEFPILQGVSGLETFLWALINLVTALVIGFAQSLVLRLAAVNTRLIPFG